jgi:hypothetical protein
MATGTEVVLEPAAREFADATADPPYVFDLGPKRGRQVVDDTEIDKPVNALRAINAAGNPITRAIHHLRYALSTRRVKRSSGDDRGC